MNNPFSIKQPKVSYTNQKRADNTEDYNDRVEIGPTHIAYNEWEKARIQAPDLPALREYRLKKIRQELATRDYGGILLFDPINIRYATDSSNMQVWCLHDLARACFVSTEGPCILWDFLGCEHLTEHLPLVDELRIGASFFYFETGSRTQEKALAFADQIKDIMQKYSGGNKRIAIDKMEIAGVEALRQKTDFVIMSGQDVMEDIRSIKNENEIRAMQCAVHACEQAVKEMHAALKPGLSENEVWSVLHAGNIKRGGEWIETRLLASGSRTNPWFQEAGPRIIKNGDLLAFDTDMVSSYGYLCDISRTWLCGDDQPNDNQKTLYKVAYDHIMHNMELLQPGISFLEMSHLGKRLPEKYRKQKYCVMMHGVGMCDEFPAIRYPEDLESCGYDGIIKEGMVLSVEAYVGEVGGREGVKLEEQVVITHNGYRKLSSYPYETDFLE